MDEPKLEKCFHCGDPVFEFKEGEFGCDGCKAIWVYTGRGWRDVTLHPMVNPNAFKPNEEK